MINWHDVFNVSGRLQLKSAQSTYPVFADHDLLNLLALAQAHLVRPIESAGDLSAGDERQSLHTLEVGVLDAHDAGFGKQSLRVVVDELAVDEAVDPVGLDLCDLGLHFLLRSPKQASDSITREVMEQVARTRSARSSSASLPVPSTRTRAPKIFTLSVSIAEQYPEV